MFAYLVMVGGGSDGTIISADSLGQVIFWDGKSLAQIKSFKAHAADAQCLVISPVSPGLNMEVFPMRRIQADVDRLNSMDIERTSGVHLRT
jgi:hypothetical protein